MRRLQQIEVKYMNVREKIIRLGTLAYLNGITENDIKLLIGIRENMREWDNFSKKFNEDTVKHMERKCQKLNAKIKKVKTNETVYTSNQNS